MSMSRASSRPYEAKLRGPVCTFGVRANEAAVTEITFLPSSEGERAPANRLAAEACRQIEAYLADAGFRFDLPIALRGTAFQRRVWEQIAAIAPGRTRTYGELARVLASAPRAVGQACGANDFPLVIPCHRVVAASGLGGFAHHDSGFLPGVKRWLLGHEAVR